MQRGDPLRNSQNWPILRPTLKGYKILNTSRILASLVWMHAEFILVFLDAKISMKQQ